CGVTMSFSARGAPRTLTPNCNCGPARAVMPSCETAAFCSTRMAQTVERNRLDDGSPLFGNNHQRNHRLPRGGWFKNPELGITTLRACLKMTPTGSRRGKFLFLVGAEVTRL